MSEADKIRSEHDYACEKCLGRRRCSTARLLAAYDAMKRAYLRAMQCPHIEAVSKGEHSCSCIDDLVEK